MQSAHRRKAGWRSVRRGDDPFLEDLTSERDGVELELLLGAEVPVEPRLAHAQVVSQATDRRALQPSVDATAAACSRIRRLVPVAI